MHDDDRDAAELSDAPTSAPVDPPPRHAPPSLPTRSGNALGWTLLLLLAAAVALAIGLATPTAAAPCQDAYQRCCADEDAPMCVPPQPCEGWDVCPPECDDGRSRDCEPACRPRFADSCDPWCGFDARDARCDADCGLRWEDCRSACSNRHNLGRTYDAEEHFADC